MTRYCALLLILGSYSSRISINDVLKFYIYKTSSKIFEGFFSWSYVHATSCGWRTLLVCTAYTTRRLRSWGSYKYKYFDFLENRSSPYEVYLYLKSTSQYYIKLQSNCQLMKLLCLPEQVYPLPTYPGWHWHIWVSHSA